MLKLNNLYLTKEGLCFTYFYCALQLRDILFLKKRQKKRDPIALRFHSSFETNGSTSRIKYKVLEDGSFQLGSNLSFPLTLSGINKEEAEKIVEAVGSQTYYQIREWLSYLIASKNVQCKEISEWTAYAKSIVQQETDKKIKECAEWDISSELDRADILLEIKNDVISSLESRPADIEATEILLFEQPKDLTIDDKILEKLDGDLKAYHTLLFALSCERKVLVVPSDSYYRKQYETLTQKGFFKRGQEIEVDAILETLTMKTMQEIAGESAPRKFTRKAQAQEFLKTLPDLKERLGKVISYRELFQLNLIEGLDVEEVRKSYNYSRCVAEIILKTLSMATQNLSLDRDMGDYTLHSEDCCPSCKKLNGKNWVKIPKKLPPFHIGCDASIY